MSTNRFTKTREGLVAKPLSFDDYTKAGVVKADSMAKLSQFAATDLSYNVLDKDQEVIGQKVGMIENSIDEITKAVSEGNVSSSVVDTALAAKREQNNLYGKHGDVTLAEGNLQVKRMWEAKINELAVAGKWPESKKQEILRRGNDRFQGSFDQTTGNFVDFKPEFTTVIDEAQFYRDTFAQIKASSSTTVQNKLDSKEYEFKNVPEYDGFVLFNSKLGKVVTNEPQITQALNSLNKQIKDPESVIGSEIDYFNTGTEEERAAGIQEQLDLAESISKEYITKDYTAEEIDAKFHQYGARRLKALYPDTNPTGGGASVVNKLLSPVKSKETDLATISPNVADIVNLLTDTDVDSRIVEHSGQRSFLNPFGTGTSVRESEGAYFVDTQVGSPQMQTLENEVFNPTSELGSWLIHKKASGDTDFDDFNIRPMSEFILQEGDKRFPNTDAGRLESEYDIDLIIEEKYPGEAEYNIYELDKYLKEIEGLVSSYGQVATSEVIINDKLGRKRLGYDKTKTSLTLDRTQGANDLLDHMGSNVTQMYAFTKGVGEKVDKKYILELQEEAKKNKGVDLKLLGEVGIDPEILGAFGDDSFDMTGAQTMEFTKDGVQTQIYVQSLDFKRVFSKQFPNGEATIKSLSNIVPIEQTTSLMRNPNYRGGTASAQYLKVNLTKADDDDNLNKPSPFAKLGEKTPYVAVLPDGGRHRVSLDYLLDKNIFRYAEGSFKGKGLSIANLTGVKDETDVR